MKYLLILIGVLHVALGAIYSVLTSIIITIVKSTRGEVFFIWKFTPTIFVFVVLPMVFFLPLKLSSLERGLIVIILDSFYVLGGLAGFVYYANNILLRMG